MYLKVSYFSIFLQSAEREAQAMPWCMLITSAPESQAAESLSQFIDMRDCNILTFPTAKLLSNKTILAPSCQFIMKNYFSFAQSLDKINGRQLHQTAFRNMLPNKSKELSPLCVANRDGFKQGNATRVPAQKMMPYMTVVTHANTDLYKNQLV